MPIVRNLALAICHSFSQLFYSSVPVSEEVTYPYSFQIDFFSLSIISLRFIQVVCIGSGFYFIVAYGMDVSGFYNNSPIKGHLGSFHLRLLQIKLLLIFIYKYLCEFLWENCPELQLLGCIVNPFLTLNGTNKLFF